jgi:hypothetical protein
MDYALCKLLLKAFGIDRLGQMMIEAPLRTLEPYSSARAQPVRVIRRMFLPQAS